MKTFEDILADYVDVLGVIAEYRSDIGDDLASTPYAFETKRTELHNDLWGKLSSGLDFVEGFSNSDGYNRSKELFSRLDKIFAVYNDFPLDLSDAHCRFLLVQDLNRFLWKSETRMYLEGKINHIGSVV